MDNVENFVLCEYVMLMGHGEAEGFRLQGLGFRVQGMWGFGFLKARGFLSEDPWDPKP